MNMKKIFDENGDFELQFPADSIDQIKEWLSPIEYSYAIKFAKEVDCPVFGKALQFPCGMEE